MNNTINSNTIQTLNNYLSAQTEWPSNSLKVRSIEQAIDELLQITAAIEEEQNLSWEQREEQGTAELLRIHHDALSRPLSEAEFARSKQIVESLNATRT